MLRPRQPRARCSEVVVQVGVGLGVNRPQHGINVAVRQPYAKLVVVLNATRWILGDDSEPTPRRAGIVREYSRRAVVVGASVCFGIVHLDGKHPMIVSCSLPVPRSNTVMLSSVARSAEP